MKKVTLIFTCFLLAFALAACGDASDSSNDSDGSNVSNTSDTSNGSGVSDGSDASNGSGVSDDSDASIASGVSDGSDTVESSVPDTTAENAGPEEITSQELSGQEFSNIEVDLATGKLSVLSGDSFSLTYDNGKAAEYSISADTLYVSNPDGRDDLVLTLPDGYAYDAVTFTVDKGHLYVEPLLEANCLTLDLSNGEATLGEISVSESCTLDIKRGSAFLSGSLSGTVTAQCREGHLQLQPAGEKSSFNYQLEVSNGNIMIGDETYHGSVDKTISNGVDDTMNLFCTKGEISVEFVH